MNKKFIQVSITVLFLITACGQLPARKTPAATSIFVNAVNTATLFRTPTYTATSIPTETPTASITPLPAIPTFTPTFDMSRIVTVTPAPKVECPKENPSAVAKFTTPNSDGSYEHYRASDIVDYLNSGGPSAQLKDSGIAETIDLTNDGVNEVVYKGLFKVGISILGCKDGYFQDLLDFGGDSGVDLADVVDLNKKESLRLFSITLSTTVISIYLFLNGMETSFNR